MNKEGQFHLTAESAFSSFVLRTVPVAEQVGVRGRTYDLMIHSPWGDDKTWGRQNLSLLQLLTN